MSFLAAAATANPKTRPAPEKVVEALVAAEKTAKKHKPHHTFAELTGTWRLRFVTGTRKERSRSQTPIFGRGSYLPRWVWVSLTYTPGELPAGEESTPSLEPGQVENCVRLGGIEMTIGGLARWLPDKRLLVFDFTRLRISLFGRTLYQGTIRGGQASENTFYQTAIAKQPFFAFFLVEPEAIAARGREGGLALWSRGEPPN